MAHPSYLSPSELGSKDYWESYYSRTRAHLTHSPNSAYTSHANDNTNTNDSDAEEENTSINEEDDPGTSWFAEHNAPEKVARFLRRRSFPLSPRNGAAPRILDLGTGNGSMLALLRKRGGFWGPMVGVDYSAQSVELARELQLGEGHAAYRTDSEDEESESESDDGDEPVAGNGNREEKGNQGNEDATPIQFEEWDILNSDAPLSESGLETVVPADKNPLSWFPYAHGGFDIVLDKGTFDAVSLADDAQTSRVCERYPDIARRLVRRGGFVVVTSCNWTEEELVRWFTGTAAGGDHDRLVVWGRVEYPRFQFGGQEGQGVCSVCFQRVSSS
ncbi:hypothetical protein NUU61_005090 [Penicillium alfredii]|uniref:Protein-lysine N-methyltransferase EFM4 n=1 Tax=Penicillium alfredii TaxID=1506179 RepID=A0A9W9F936_9EURO|nr:uncharacterized protein NUU61_005090 [Penicillium alfredii]KAJ5095734.1 hypothetical protein NUU61_005090 [Penicillium alfredii]